MFSIFLFLPDNMFYNIKDNKGSVLYMDKRIRKTNQALYKGLTLLLQEKNYNKITIEDLIQASNISRSTFYSHFKTKDDVLESIIKMITEHVFSHSLKEENTHDFSKASIFEYTHLITHILYHLHDEKKLISAILSSESKEIFVRDLKKELEPIAIKSLELGVIKTKNLPQSLRKEEIMQNFITLIIYWFNNNCKETPEILTQYFFKMNE